ncbi:hypothetical protein BDD12DRAFT_461164 [Trichophaea hybrida]|nr:hypothetical protein BDD12DRAFT_461164 [Trichophaea hybrida]
MHHPPTPKSTPSPSPDNDTSNETRPHSSLHQRKRQRTDGSSLSSRASSPVPLTPPRSPRSSPVAESHTNFDSLSPELRQKIILETAALSTMSAAQIGDYTATTEDPRMLNKRLVLHLYRRRTLTKLATVNSFWRKCLEPLLSSGPRVFVSSDELSELAGNEYRLDGKTIDRPVMAYSVWNESQPKDARWPPRKRVKKSAKEDIPEIICWMTSIPWRRDNSEIGQRWPQWYILDWMRYDLEDLKVEKLAAVAAHQATIADALHATIPNHSRLTQLHFEVFHQMGAISASDPRFDNVYRHCPDTQHLCSRLQLHKDTLESLSLRNIAVCPILAPIEFPKLQNLDLYWVNNLPGLCQDHFPDPLDSTRMPKALDAEVYGLRWHLEAMAAHKPHTRVWAAMAYDRPNLDTGAWLVDSKLLISRGDNGQLYVAPDSLWNDITYGVRTHADLQVFDDEEEIYSDTYDAVDWLDDEDDEEEEEAIEIDEEEEVEEDEEKGKGRLISRVGNERAIAPAPPAYRPLKIR